MAPAATLGSLLLLLLQMIPSQMLSKLSDFKTCGDPECARYLSRVTATLDYTGRDCRFLTFKHGDSIYVYFKLSGKRDDLWAGSIGKQFGYFPKDAVKVDDVMTSTEVELPTQESDFLCLDEDNYHVDSEENDVVIDEYGENSFSRPEERESILGHEPEPNKNNQVYKGNSAKAEPVDNLIDLYKSQVQRTLQNTKLETNSGKDQLQKSLTPDETIQINEFLSPTNHQNQLNDESVSSYTDKDEFNQFSLPESVYSQHIGTTKDEHPRQGISEDNLISMESNEVSEFVQEGSNWIGSKINRWFGLESNEVKKMVENTDQSTHITSFKSRKIPLDCDENTVVSEEGNKNVYYEDKEILDSGMSGWFGGLSKLLSLNSDLPEDVLSSNEGEKNNLENIKSYLVDDSSEPSKTLLTKYGNKMSEYSEADDSSLIYSQSENINKENQNLMSSVQTFFGLSDNLWFGQINKAKNSDLSEETKVTMGKSRNDKSESQWLNLNPLSGIFKFTGDSGGQIFRTSEDGNKRNPSNTGGSNSQWSHFSLSEMLGFSQGNKDQVSSFPDEIKEVIIENRKEMPLDDDGPKSQWVSISLKDKLMFGQTNEDHLEDTKKSAIRNKNENTMNSEPVESFSTLNSATSRVASIADSFINDDPIQSQRQDLNMMKNDVMRQSENLQQSEKEHRETKGEGTKSAFSINGLKNIFEGKISKLQCVQELQEQSLMPNSYSVGPNKRLTPKSLHQDQSLQGHSIYTSEIKQCISDYTRTKNSLSGENIYGEQEILHNQDLTLKVEQSSVKSPFAAESLSEEVEQYLTMHFDKDPDSETTQLRMADNANHSVSEECQVEGEVLEDNLVCRLKSEQLLSNASDPMLVNKLQNVKKFSQGQVMNSDFQPIPFIDNDWHPPEKKMHHKHQREDVTAAVEFEQLDASGTYSSHDTRVTSEEQISSDVLDKTSQTSNHVQEQKGMKGTIENQVLEELTQNLSDKITESEKTTVEAGAESKLANQLQKKSQDITNEESNYHQTEEKSSTHLNKIKKSSVTDDPRVGTPTDNDIEYETNVKKTANHKPGSIFDLGLQNLTMLIDHFIQNSYLTVMDALSEDLGMSPNLHGPCTEFLISVLLGIITALLFVYRTCQAVKSRRYMGREKQLAERVSQLFDEKCKVLETLSSCKQKYSEFEASVKNAAGLKEATEANTLHLQDAYTKLDKSNDSIRQAIDQFTQDLEGEKQTKSRQSNLITKIQANLCALENEAQNLKIQVEEAKKELKAIQINDARHQESSQAAKEENSHLKQSKEQLLQESEGWNERYNELTEHIKLSTKSHKDIRDVLACKENEVKSLTDCLLKMKLWNQVEEDNPAEEISEEQRKQKIEKLIHVAKVNASLKSVEEERNQIHSKLADETKAKQELMEPPPNTLDILQWLSNHTAYPHSHPTTTHGTPTSLVPRELKAADFVFVRRERIEKLQLECTSVQCVKTQFENEYKTIQQKLKIMTELYHEKEMELQRNLTLEEHQRLQKEDKLFEVDEKMNQATEELAIYRQRAKDLEGELIKTMQSYKNQIVSHEKKAHDNWLSAREAERELGNIKRENIYLRQKIIEAELKMDNALKDPLVHVSGRPALSATTFVPAYRGRSSPYGPSPVSRPGSEPVGFLSPPLIDGPSRFSPLFPGKPDPKIRSPSVQLDHTTNENTDSISDRMSDQHGPQSDSGSLSPVWERDRKLFRVSPALICADGYPELENNMQTSNSALESHAQDCDILNTSRNQSLPVEAEFGIRPNFAPVYRNQVPFFPVNLRGHAPLRGPPPPPRVGIYGPPERFPLRAFGLPPPPSMGIGERLQPKLNRIRHTFTKYRRLNLMEVRDPRRPGPYLNNFPAPRPVYFPHRPFSDIAGGLLPSRLPLPKFPTTEHPSSQDK
ncbi:cTAGE family member 5 isoform X6 [Narcine bancroftii]|uniref:cTAGE family member 5 isoform X6 n=1 Tax=Narcine bancroftii TaxID=1343680 RepID=UPI003831337C